MISRIAIINAGLALVALFFGFQTVQVWRADPVDLPKPVAAPADPGRQDVAKIVSAKRVGAKTTYREIAEKNLFAVDRKEYRPVEIEAKEDIVTTEVLKIDGQKITLFGVMQVGEQQSALINNPDPKAEGRKLLWVKAGDPVGSLKVEAISPQGIVFADGAKKFQVDLYDRTKQRQEAPVVPRSEAPVVVTTEVKKPPVATPKSIPKPSENLQNQDEYEMVRTPFGVVKRKKK